MPVFAIKKHPVPKVLFSCPLSKQPCPIKDACWSPAIPDILISPPKSLVEPKSAVFFVTSGRFKPPNSNIPNKLSSHLTELIFNNDVLDAFVTSVLKLFPSVNFQTRNVSMVPKNIYLNQFYALSVTNRL